MKIRSHLTFVVLSTLLPVLIFITVLIVLYHAQTRRTTEDGLVDTARALATLVDQELSASIAALQLLGTSEPLRAGELREFDRIARSILTSQTRWDNLVLYDPTGLQLLNLRVPFGTPLGTTPSPDVLEQVAHPGTPGISNLFRGQNSAKLLLRVAVPIIEDGSVRYILAATMEPASFGSLLSPVALPAGSFIALLDRDYVIVARSRAAEQFVGQRATPELVARATQMSEGSFRALTKEGTSVYAAISRSRRSGWVVALGVPQAVVDGPLRTSLGNLTASAVLAVLLGTALAISLGRRLERTIFALVTAAQRLIKGEAVTLARSPVTEMNALAEAVETASRELSRGQQATAALARVSQAFTEAPDVATVGRQIIENVRPLFQAISANLRLLGPDGSLQTIARRGVVSTPRLEPGAGISGAAITAGAPIVSLDVLTDSRIHLADLQRRVAVESGVVAWLAVPLRVNGEIIGALAIGDQRGRDFTQSEVTLLQTFADQAALALRQAQLFEESEHRRHTAEALAEIGRVLSKTLDPDLVGASIVDSVRTLLAARSAVLYSLDSASGVLTRQTVSTDVGPVFDWSPRLEAGMGIAGPAVEQRRPIMTSDALADAGLVYLPETRARVAQSAHRALLAVPLVLQDRVLGALVVADTTGRIYHEQDTQLAQAFADQAVMALTNAQLYAQAERRRHAAEGLAEVGQLISLSLDPEEVGQRIVDSVRTLFTAQNAAVYRVHPDSGDLLAVAFAGDMGTGFRRGTRLLGGTAAAGAAIEARGPIFTADLLNDPRIRLETDSRSRIEQTTYRAVLAIPLIVKHEVIGALSIGDRAGRVFDAEDLRLAQAFAGQAAIALQNARLYQELYCTYDDLSQTQAQLAQAQKMEAVGQLAGGIAHDFNNLLTVISGRAQLLLSQLLSDNPVCRSIEEIGKAADRAATLTRQLLAFSRRQVLRPTVLDLNRVVSNLIPMLQSLLGETIELQLSLGAAPALVAADEGQLEQVITNLVVNARDAMPNGGRLTIRTTTRVIAAAGAPEHPNLRPGPYVVFELTDTGHGMRPEIQARIFEPFFSTKGVGKGTGLGLSMVYGIIRQHEGDIAVDSQEGRGSTFTIYLPPTLAASRFSEPSPDSRATVTTGTETILLAEDHDDVRSVARDILAASGYTVLEARNGPEAIQIAQAASEPIDLLVTDVVMPQLSGWELAKQLKESRPGLKVLFMSGHTDDALVRHGIFASHVAFLSKPFRPEVLAQKVREVLDTPP